MRRQSANDRERGAVIVLVAIWLPVLLLFASFAIDIAHFFDYSRNLQNRADAAALAAGQEFGGTCFATPTSTQTDVIGRTAQQYAGPPNGTPNTGNTPFAISSVSGYQNLPTLTKGTPANFHMLLNSNANWPNGANWNMGSDAAHQANSTAICSSTDGSFTGPMVDVRLTQANLGLFFSLLPGFAPNISAHARVQLESAASSTSTLPIAVPDPAQTPCLYAVLINDNTGNPVTAPVAMTPPNPSGTPPQPFWTVTLPQITIPAAQLSVQAYIPDDCSNPGYSSTPGSSAGSLFDSALPDSTAKKPDLANHGIVFINTYAPLPNNPSNPTIGSVYLVHDPAGDCTDPTESSSQDAYFYYFPKSTSCSVFLCADVEFPSSGFGSAEVDAAMDTVTATGPVTGPATKMNAPGSSGDPCPATDTNAYWLTEPITSQSYQHTFVLSWMNGGGSTNFNGGNPLQATYSAISDGSDPADDSGPVTQAFVLNAAGNPDFDSIQQGTQPTISIAFGLQGLVLAQPGDAPIILRAAVQDRKATGAFDCGQGIGASAASGLASAIENGCPDPVAIYNQTQGCVFYTTPPTTPLTCAALVPGNKRNQVTNAFQSRVESVSCTGSGSVCPDGNKVSPCDEWQAYAAGGAIPGFEPWNSLVPDPRIMIMAVTSPADLAGHGGPNGSVRILGFATFYVTGYDGDAWLPGGKTIPNCPSPTNQDEAYPQSGSDKDQIWGHFIKYVGVGTPNGQACNPSDVSLCVPALTR